MTTYTHFTAWITNDPSFLAGDYIDVIVLADKEGGERNGRPVWVSVGDPLFHADTTVRPDGSADKEAEEQAKALLEQAGWQVTGDFEGVTTGYIATVEPVA